MRSANGSAPLLRDILDPPQDVTPSGLELFLPPATKFGQGNIFRSVCQEFCPRGGGAWCGVGACMAGGMHSRGHEWQGVHVWQGVCMVGGRGCAW